MVYEMEYRALYGRKSKEVDAESMRYTTGGVFEYVTQLGPNNIIDYSQGNVVNAYTWQDWQTAAAKIFEIGGSGSRTVFCSIGEFSKLVTMLWDKVRINVNSRLSHEFEFEIYTIMSGSGDLHFVPSWVYGQNRARSKQMLVLDFNSPNFVIDVREDLHKESNLQQNGQRLKKEGFIATVGMQRRGFSHAIVTNLPKKGGRHHAHHSLFDCGPALRGPHRSTTGHRLADVHDAKELKTLDDVFTVMESLDGTTIATGVRELKEVGIDSWFMGNLMILAGDTGTFKTTTAVNLNMAALIANPDLHVIYFMKEQPFHEVWYKAFTYWSPYSYTRVQAQMNARNPEMIQDVRSSLTDEAINVLNRFHVVDQNDFSRPGDIANQLRHYATKYPKIMWVVDYITRLDFGGRPEHFNSYYAEGLNVLKNAALQTNSFGVIISQFKDGWNIDFKTSKPVKMFPNRSHIIWSSENKNLSAYIMLLYHPATYFDYPKNYLYAVMGKVRHTDSARRMNFLIDGSKQRLSSPSEADGFNMNTIVEQFKSMK